MVATTSGMVTVTFVVIARLAQCTRRRADEQGSRMAQSSKPL
ncbi:hypothetical protein [Oculatella sp. FACHB-28]|nr:hypothetical protein [Oculatella sp. FACHB-28]